MHSHSHSKGKLFVPTMHGHDGHAAAEPDWDHYIYSLGRSQWTLTPNPPNPNPYLILYLPFTL